MGMLWFGSVIPHALIHILFGLPCETGKQASETPTLPNIPVDLGSLTSVKRHQAFLAHSFLFYQFLTRRMPRDAKNCFQEKVGLESLGDGG